MKADDTLESLGQKLEVIRQNMPKDCEEVPGLLADYVYGELGSLLERQPENLKTLFGTFLDAKEMEEWPAKMICAGVE